MSKFFARRKSVVSNSKVVFKPRSKTAAQVFTLSDSGEYVLKKHIFLWPLREKINIDKKLRHKHIG